VLGFPADRGIPCPRLSPYRSPVPSNRPDILHSRASSKALPAGAPSQASSRHRRTVCQTVRITEHHEIVFMEGTFIPSDCGKSGQKKAAFLFRWEILQIRQRWSNVGQRVWIDGAPLIPDVGMSGNESAQRPVSALCPRFAIFWLTWEHGE
jgi:hypothetical protein